MPAGDYTNCRRCGKAIFGANFLCHDCALKMESYGTSYNVDGQITNITDDIEDGTKILAATLNNMLKKDARRHMDTLAKVFHEPPISDSSFEYFWNNYMSKIDKVTPEQEETLDDLYYQIIDDTETISENCKCDECECEQTTETPNKDKETLEEVFDNFFNESPAPVPKKIVSKEFDELFEDMGEKKMTTKTNKRKTLVVNLFAGPGAGKSTLAAGVFYELKSRGINCEIATEFVKDLVWEERHKAINNQIYIFAKQHHRITRLYGKVDVIITDSPLLLTLVYGNLGDELLKRLASLEHYKLWSFNCLIKRDKKYNPNGRLHTYDEAKNLDKKIATMLDNEEVPYGVYFGNTDGKDKIVNKILQLIGKKNNMIGKYKKFSSKLFKQNDPKSRKVVKEYFARNNIPLEDNSDKYCVDLLSKDGSLQIEVEHRLVWDSEEFPYDEVNVLERKAKYFVENHICYVILSKDYSRIGMIDGKTLRKYLTVDTLKESSNRFVKKGEMFFKVPKSEFKWDKI